MKPGGITVGENLLTAHGSSFNAGFDWFDPGLMIWNKFPATAATSNWDNFMTISLVWTGNYLRILFLLSLSLFVLICILSRTMAVPYAMRVEVPLEHADEWNCRSFFACGEVLPVGEAESEQPKSSQAISIITAKTWSFPVEAWKGHQLRVPFMDTPMLETRLEGRSWHHLDQLVNRMLSWESAEGRMRRTTWSLV